MAPGRTPVETQRGGRLVGGDRRAIESRARPIADGRDGPGPFDERIEGVGVHARGVHGGHDPHRPAPRTDRLPSTATAGRPLRLLARAPASTRRRVRSRGRQGHRSPPPGTSSASRAPSARRCRPAAPGRCACPNAQRRTAAWCHGRLRGSDPERLPVHPRRPPPPCRRRRCRSRRSRGPRRSRPAASSRARPRQAHCRRRRVGHGHRPAVAGTRDRHTQMHRAGPAAVLDGREEAGLEDPQHVSPRQVRSGRGRRPRGGRVRSGGASQRDGVGQADEMPAARCRRGIDGGLPARDGDAACRYARPRLVTTGHHQLAWQPSEVAEAGREAEHEDPVLDRGVQFDDLSGRQGRVARLPRRGRGHPAPP